VTVGLEALNRFECYLLNTMDDLAAFIRRVGHPNIRAMYDTFHANIEEADPIGALTRNRAEVVHIHLSENDRGVPGRGNIPWGGRDGYAHIARHEDDQGTCAVSGAICGGCGPVQLVEVDHGLGCGLRLCRGAGSQLGRAAVRSGEGRCVKGPTATTFKGQAAEAGIEVTELSTHLQGQLVAVHPAYDTAFDGFAAPPCAATPRRGRTGRWTR
jgi:hypothetical protein